jgi:hypothetical protein
MHTVIKFHFSQIMLVPTLQMNHLPKQTLSHHIQYCHYISAITHIFQHHHMRMRTFLLLAYNSRERPIISLGTVAGKSARKFVL